MSNKKNEKMKKELKDKFREVASAAAPYLKDIIGVVMDRAKSDITDKLDNLEKKKKKRRKLPTNKKVEEEKGN